MTTKPETKTRGKRGAGSLIDLGGGRYRVAFYVDGCKVTRVFHAANGTEARETAPSIRLDALDAYREKHAAIPAEDAARADRQGWTVERYAAYYMSEWASRKLAATTQDRYRQVIRKQITPRLGKKLMCEVTVMDIVKMQADLAADGVRCYGGRLSAATITKVHNVLGAIFSFAVDVQEDFPTNPVHSAKARVNDSGGGEWREDVQKAAALDVAGVSRFVELARAEEPAEVFAAILLSARLGLRRGEALALQWRDIDVTARRATIRRAVSQATVGERVEGQKRETTVSAKPTKTNKVRHIPIGDELIAELGRIQKRQAALRLASSQWQGGKTAVQDYITATPTGAVLEPEAYTSRFRALAKRHEIDVTPHVLRHSWCSQMIALGYDAVTIASMSGHSPDVLLRIYGHAFDARKREAVDAYDAAWRAVAAGE
ncbi:MAG TPA: site-specific integrase [Coriobacteriia bacterium]